MFRVFGTPLSLVPSSRCGGSHLPNAKVPGTSAGTELDNGDVAISLHLRYMDLGFKPSYGT